MGLDMYLEGEKYYYTNWDDPSKNLTEDGFELKTKRLRIGYWRKHPNLHGFIVKTFAGGADTCQDIELGVKELALIANATREHTLPETSGFFFGESGPEDDEPTLKIIDDAINWLEAKHHGETRSIHYRASW